MLDQMQDNLWASIDSRLEQIKFLRGHQDHEGWDLKTDEEGDTRFACGCGEYLDDKEEAEEP
jgi:hypothetical protein